MALSLIAGGITYGLSAVSALNGWGFPVAEWNMLLLHASVSVIFFWMNSRTNLALRHMPESDRVFRALKLTVLVIGIPPTVRREVMLKIPAGVGVPRRKVSARPAVPILILSLEHIPPATFFSLIGVYLLLAVYAVVCIVGLHRLYYGLHLPLSNLIFLVVGLSALPGYLVYNITRHFGALIKITYEVVALPKEDQPEESAE